MRLLPTAALAMLVSFSPAPAGPTFMSALAATATTANGPSRATDKAEKRICRTEDLTGTRMTRRKICMTAEDWALQKLSAEEIVRQRQTNDVIQPEPRSAGAAGPQR